MTRRRLALGLAGAMLALLGLRTGLLASGQREMATWQLERARSALLLAHRLGSSTATEALIDTLLWQGDLRGADALLTAEQPTAGMPRARWLRRRAVVLFGFHRVDEALDSIEQAKGILDGQADPEARALAARLALDEGRILYFSKGRLEQAEALTAAALETARHLGNGALEAHALRNLGVILWLRDVENGPRESHYRPALEIYRRLGHRWGEAVTLSNLALLDLEDGDVHGFLRGQSQSLAIKEAIGDRLGQSESLTYLADLYRRMGNFRRAFSLADRGLALAEQIGYRVGADILNYRLAHLELLAGRVREGEARLEALTRATREPWTASLRWWALTDVRLKLGKLEDAQASFREAILAEQKARHQSTEGLWLKPLTEARLAVAQGRRSLARELVEEARAMAPGRRPLWQELELLAAEIALEGDDSPRRAVELLVTLVELQGRELGDTTASLLLGDPASAKRHRDQLFDALIDNTAGLERDLLVETTHRALELQRHRALRNLVVSTGGRRPSSGASPPQAPDLLAAPENRQAARAQIYDSYARWEEQILAARLDEAERDAVRTLRPRPLASSRQILGDSSALVEYLVTPKRAAALLSTREGSMLLPLPTDRGTLEVQIELFRFLLSRSDPGSSWHPVASALADSLLAPLLRSGGLEGVERLYLLPQGPLHDVPFAALLPEIQGSRSPLIERYSLVRLPAAATLHRPAPQPAEGGALAFGHAGAGNLPPSEALVNADEEAREVAARLRGRALTGSEASEARFKSSALSARFIHIASHGQNVDRWPLLSGIRLAAGEGQDGWLSFPEILDLRTDAELVVLSACETGQTGALIAPDPGDALRISLADAFLYAGVSNVIASLMRVDDRSSRQLMESFYQLLPDHGPGRALTLARRRAASDASVHPSVWAGFALFGSGAG